MTEPRNAFINDLRADGHEILADVLERTQYLTPQKHSQAIWEYRPQRPLDQLFINAFTHEAQRCGYDDPVIDTLLDTCTTHRTIQTSAHTEIASPPRRFCIDWISTRGIPKNIPYIVCAFSGVPFSNKSRPGRITHDGTVYNFIPKTYQDALAYHMPIVTKMTDIYEELPSELHTHIPHPREHASFVHWASNTLSNLSTTALNHPTYVLDINAIATHYLIQALDDPDHILTRMLTDPEITQRILDVFGENTHFFYTPYETGKYTRQENVYYLDGYGFAGDKQRYPADRIALHQALTQKKLCPGTLLVFTIFSFLNEFQCLGSFVQVEYLTRFKKMWQALDLLPESIDHVPTDTLTTGMFPHNPHTQMLDVLTGITPLTHDPNLPLLDYYAPIWNNKEYYTNKQT